jgi:hypothetical protein
MAAAGRDDREAASARPIDQVANQRRLIAIGQAVDHTRIRRLLGEQRPAKRIRFHGHVDDVLARAESR